MPLDNRSLPLPYADRFADVGATLPGHDLRWLRDLRTHAIERVRQSGLPTIRNERWKYTNLKPLAVVAFEPAKDGAAVAFDRLPSIAGACRIVFVNGRYRQDLSTKTPPKGLSITGFAALLRDEPTALESALAASDTPEDALETLNLAFAADGYVIRLAAGAVIDAPIEIVHVATAAASPVATHSRNLVIAGRNSSAGILDTFMGDSGAVYWSQPVTDICVGPGATLRHYKDQNEGTKAFHTAHAKVRVAENGRYESFLLTTGAALSRNEITVTLDGEGASCRLDSGYLARGRQHVDNTTEIVHAKPHTSSEEVYKGVLDEQARGVFQGRIVVAKDAQKSDGHQLSKTILLSDRAEIDTKPELEIFADDVKCSHGATAGELDEDALFYLRTRGIDQPDARRMLVEAFVGDALAKISEESVRAAFERRVGQWMSVGSELAA
jgi:Fe-S cluster assembly protein SufD